VRNWLFHYRLSALLLLIPLLYQWWGVQREKWLPKSVRTTALVWSSWVAVVLGVALCGLAMTVRKPGLDRRYASPPGPSLPIVVLAPKPDTVPPPMPKPEPAPVPVPVAR
jgi:hypothetical protein